ncbi:hypothetical protein CMS3027 [Clavibacter sepedonicus]|uniref:Uncharacterized protein n=1 Tax=Clavibacter sepedonicus TaxID=31964 RepID=B0RD04_CLASE|nr:hypothetical protein CMS3027 [Clavibacter sepedonicus]
MAEGAVLEPDWWSTRAQARLYVEELQENDFPAAPSSMY